ncbi:MAG: lytic transglycosylase F [Pseudomonadales bacterium RIFCSPLOWO2_12_59_9]|uniref:transglycosylase SLT domain-containing protein n=1 Tax=Pseudomonas sp. TaxID=306 RepID=UPI0008C88F90|nr:MAG: lytic transglycosylase F [Pseudomonadales bacterium RIFCSPLOWO2_12_59_9]
MRRRLLICLLALLPLSATARLAGSLHAEKNAPPAHDLAEIRSSGVLRVLINQSRNSSAEVKGQALGTEQQRLRAFEQYLNRDNSRKLSIKLIPKAKNQLLPALLRGEGDLVVPGELLNPGQEQAVSASRALHAQVPVVLVSAKGARRYLRLQQLAGRSLTLAQGSAAEEAIRQVNQQLAARHLAPILIEWADPSLAVEDVLEMVQAGLYPLTAVELPIAERWAKVMPKLRIDRHLQLDNRGDMHWYLSRQAPMLGATLERFLQSYVSPADQDAAFLRVNRRAYRVHNPLARADRQKLEKLRPLLQRHALQNDFDWLSLAALAYKESSFNPRARGGNAPSGLMQITASAAQSVGVSNSKSLEGNVQAAAKYMGMLRRRFFASPQIAESERLAFVLAAYNMGPERVQGLRAEARRRGLNPNQWFFQVERVAMEQVGMGVVGYVSSVNKYQLAFARERESLERPKTPAKAAK